jgi:hypothetical protein
MAHSVDRLLTVALSSVAMKRIEWPHGREHQAETWGELLDAVRLDQPTTMSRLRFRLELRRQARQWSGVKVPIIVSDESFVRSLANAGLFRIVEDS